MTTLENLRLKKKELLALAAKYGVVNIRVFGSVARGDDTSESDIDLLIAMEEGRTGFDAGGFQYYSSELLGRHVDIVFEKGIYPSLRDRILREAQPV